MEFLSEIPELILRWLHVLFAIMWVGNSIFFNWLENHLLPAAEKKDDVEGELWMLHGGGFFHVEKRPVIPGKLPKFIHWFKWEAYTTWMTGFLLLGIVYYLSGGIYLAIPQSTLQSPWPEMIGLSVLIIGWLSYDWLWRSRLGSLGGLPICISIALLVLLAFSLEYVFQGRGMYIHIGALLGTCMAGNVFFHIIPSQKKMMTAAETGSLPDPDFSTGAKLRSRQNNYMTFPVIFLMISTHFPSTYGHSNPWLVLTILVIGSALVKHFMNLSLVRKNWLGEALVAALCTLLILVFVILNFNTSGSTPDLAVLGRELLNLLGRWIHVIFGIMWIGNSLFFNWMDLSLKPPESPRKNILGELWMLHGGSFFFVEKHALTPGFIPNPLHWFKYEAYFTWISGFFLLWVVYYLGGGTYLINPEIYPLELSTGIAVGLGLLFLGWLAYDQLWKTSLVEEPEVGATISFILLILIAFGLTHLLGSRAAFLHVGALLGTLMAGNVFFHIIPSQKRMMGAVERNETPQPNWGLNAKYRSKHNNYMTFPLLFTMISNHFPAIYGHEFNWLILTILFFTSALIKHFLNIPHYVNEVIATLKGNLSRILERDDRSPSKITVFDQLILGLICLAFLFFGFLQIPTSVERESTSSAMHESQVSFQQVRTIINQRCTTCHAANPTDRSMPVPAGVYFDKPELIQKFASRIKARAVDSKSMPLGNKTRMRDHERKVLGDWIKAGAKIN